MHQVHGACVGVQVALDRRLASLVAIAAATTVKDPEEESQAVVEERLKDWEPCVEPHGADERVTDGAEPCRVEVCELTTCQPERNGLLAQVSTDEEQKEGSVEELHKEGHGRSLGETLSLGWEANPVNQHDADCTQDVVDDGKSVGESVDQDEGQVLLVGVVSTDLFIIGTIIGITALRPTDSFV